MRILSYKPSALWRLDDDSPFQDYSGYGRSATLSGTASHAIALVPSAAYSQVFDLNRVATFASPVYIAGREARPFSILATIYIGGTGQIQVLGKSGEMDGIVIDDDTVSFSTKYTSTGEAKCSYKIPYNKKIDIVGVHSESKNSLYIDGVLVDEVDISEEQQADTYSSSSTNLSSGLGDAGQFVKINMVGLFSYALPVESIKGIYSANNYRVEGSVAKMFDGEDIFIGQSVRPAYIDFTLDSSEDWELGSLYGSVIDGDQVVSQMKDNLTLGGVWKTSIDLYNGSVPDLVNSVTLWWEGTNETVEVSIDDTNWFAASKGVPLSVIPTGFDPEDKSLNIRVSLAAGEDEAYLESLSILGYVSNTGLSNNRVVTYTNPVSMFDEYAPGILQDESGVRIFNGGSVSIAEDAISEIPLDVNTLEVWVRQLPGASISLSSNITTDSTAYTNGAATDTYPEGEWVIKHFVNASGIIGDLIFSGDVQIGRVAIYDRALTAGEIQDIILSYTGVISMLEDGEGTITLVEPSLSAYVYAYDWEIQSS